MEPLIAKCQLCETAIKLLQCVGCQLLFCNKHSRSGYWNLKDQKGQACGQCIQKSLVYPGGVSSPVGRFRAELLSQTIPTLERRLDQMVRRTIQQDVPPLIKQTVTDSRRELEELSNQIITRLLGENRVLDIIMLKTLLKNEVF